MIEGMGYVVNDYVDSCLVKMPDGTFPYLPPVSPIDGRTYQGREVAYVDSERQFFADPVAGTISMVDPDRTYSLIAGVPNAKAFLDGPGDQAKFWIGPSVGQYFIYGVIKLSDTECLVTDGPNKRIRKVSLINGTWQVTTIAGGGTVTLAVGAAPINPLTAQLGSAFCIAQRPNGEILFYAGGLYKIGVNGLLSRLARPTSPGTGRPNLLNFVGYASMDAVDDVIYVTGREPYCCHIWRIDPDDSVHWVCGITDAEKNAIQAAGQPLPYDGNGLHTMFHTTGIGYVDQNFALLGGGDEQLRKYVFSENQTYSMRDGQFANGWQIRPNYPGNEPFAYGVIAYKNGVIYGAKGHFIVTGYKHRMQQLVPSGGTPSPAKPLNVRKVSA